MSQGTISDTLIRLKDLKRIFVFRPKIDFFLRRIKAHAFWPKMTKLSSGHFSLVYVPTDPGVSKNALRNHF